jgi:hypothetical protein
MIDLCLALLFAFAPAPELAIEIPANAAAEKHGWRSRPWRKTKTFWYGYSKWCDDPDCPWCADFVYMPNWRNDTRLVVPVRR